MCCCECHYIVRLIDADHQQRYIIPYRIYKWNGQDFRYTHNFRLIDDANPLCFGGAKSPNLYSMWIALLGQNQWRWCTMAAQCACCDISLSELIYRIQFWGHKIQYYSLVMYVKLWVCWGHLAMWFWYACMPPNNSKNSKPPHVGSPRSNALVFLAFSVSSAVLGLVYILGGKSIEWKWHSPPPRSLSLSPSHTHTHSISARSMGIQSLRTCFGSRR